LIGVVPPPPPFELRSNLPPPTARAGGRGEEKPHASNAIALPQAGEGARRVIWLASGINEYNAKSIRDGAHRASDAVHPLFRLRAGESHMERNGSRIHSPPPALAVGRGRGWGAFAHRQLGNRFRYARASRRNLRTRCLLIDGSRFIFGVVPPPPPFELRSNVPHDRAPLDRTTARAGGGEKRSLTLQVRHPCACGGELG
jgi:hypothetical protein